MDKQKLLQAVIRTLSETEASARESLNVTRKAANEALGAMQSHSDTTKWQMSQRATAIEQSLAETQQGLVDLRRLVGCTTVTTRGSVYAIVEARNIEDNSSARYFLLPAGGGNTYRTDDGEITILNVRAPMARALIGAEAGDDVEIKIGNKTKTINVVSVT